MHPAPVVLSLARVDSVGTIDTARTIVIEGMTAAETPVAVVFSRKLLTGLIAQLLATHTSGHPEDLLEAERALVQLRIDREGGQGTYASMISRIADGGPHAVALEQSLERAFARARRNIRDVFEAFGTAAEREEAARS
jgi:hypothetical protein